MTPTQTGKVSKRNIRIRWTGDSDAEGEGNKLLSLLLGGRLSVADVSTSTATSHDECHMIVTFSDRDTARKIYEKAGKSKEFERSKHHFDNTFNDLTIIKSPKDHEFDVCAVHGLEGNAIDSFMGETKLWLRDILPATKPFDKARIMTVGYNSRLFEKRSIADMTDWADIVLRAVGSVRSEDSLSSKPIIFVCHSMGGLVVRRAMEHLHQLAAIPDHYQGITLDKCGILFLSTPHYGTTEADWGSVFSEVLSSMAGLRKDVILNELESFNKSAKNAIEAWRVMSINGTRPPFECLCESRETKPPVGNHRLLVTPTAASFLDQKATQIPNVDHFGVCKFDHPYDLGYKDVLRKLQILHTKLTRPLHQHGDRSMDARLPGQLNATAFRYPLPTDQRLYFGNSLKKDSGYFAGRLRELEELLGTEISNVSVNERSITALSGIGGVGKSELLLEYALNERQRSHVFHCQAIPGHSFQDCIYKLAAMVGSEVLPPSIPLINRETVWTSYTSDQRVEAFIRWLQTSPTERCVILVDDVDAFQNDEDLETLSEALKSWPHKVLLTTRDPGLGRRLAHRSYRKEYKLYVVDSISEPELIEVMRSFIDEGCDFSESELAAISKLMYRHAMAACRAIEFICREISLKSDTGEINRFVDSFDPVSTDHEYRKRFFDYKPRLERSLAECFRTSIQRIGEDSLAALRLLNFAVYLSATTLDFRPFFKHPRPWLETVANDDLPTKELFQQDDEEFAQSFQKLVATSSIVKQGSSFIVHPLMTEYLLQKQGHKGRLRVLKQIVLLVAVSVRLGESAHFFTPYIDNCKGIAQRFRMDSKSVMPDQTTINRICTHNRQITTEPLSPPSPLVTPQPPPLAPEVQHLQARLRGLVQKRQAQSNDVLSNEERRRSFFHEISQIVKLFEQLRMHIPHALLLHLCDDMLTVANGLSPYYCEKIRNIKGTLPPEPEATQYQSQIASASIDVEEYSSINRTLMTLEGRQ